jgi:hypothetical protein
MCVGPALQGFFLHLQADNGVRANQCGFLIRIVITFLLMQEDNFLSLQPFSKKVNGTTGKNIFRHYIQVSC